MKRIYKSAFLGITLLATSIYAATPHKEWKEPFSKESHEDVQRWISDLMLKFYYAYHDNNVEEMIKLDEQIRNLVQLEFASNKDSASKEINGN